LLIVAALIGAGAGIVTAKIDRQLCGGCIDGYRFGGGAWEGAYSREGRQNRPTPLIYRGRELSNLFFAMSARVAGGWNELGNRAPRYLVGPPVCVFAQGRAFLICP
jgi:hypothetical protein